jgi:hypothetical protein
VARHVENLEVLDGVALAQRPRDPVPRPAEQPLLKRVEPVVRLSSRRRAAFGRRDLVLAAPELEAERFAYAVATALGRRMHVREDEHVDVARVQLRDDSPCAEPSAGVDYRPAGSVDVRREE